MAEQIPSDLPPPVLFSRRKKRKGFLNPAKVREFVFYVITLCIVVSVVACILAIWDFAERDTLWRTVATCVIIGGGCALFAGVNVVFGSSDEGE